MNSRQLNHQLWSNKETKSLDLLQPILALLIKLEIEVEKEQSKDKANLHKRKVLTDAVAWSPGELLFFVSFCCLKDSEQGKG
jgi:hypothetical protein